MKIIIALTGAIITLTLFGAYLFGDEDVSSRAESAGGVIIFAVGMVFMFVWLGGGFDDE